MRKPNLSKAGKCNLKSYIYRKKVQLVFGKNALFLTHYFIFLHQFIKWNELLYRIKLFLKNNKILPQGPQYPSIQLMHNWYVISTSAWAAMRKEPKSLESLTFGLFDGSAYDR